MELWQQQAAFAQDLAKLILHIAATGKHVTVGEVLRTKEQAALYSLQGKGIRNSQHCKKLAVDLFLFNDQGEYLTNVENYRPYAVYWESLSPHNRAGIDFVPLVDAVHFERRET